jgi:hypothetical protein
VRTPRQAGVSVPVGPDPTIATVIVPVRRALVGGMWPGASCSARIYSAARPVVGATPVG